MIDQKTKELLKAGKAKMDARLKVVQAYFSAGKGKAKSRSADIVKAGLAKKRARDRVVQDYLAGLNQPF